MPTISARAGQIEAFGYDHFPVAPGELDLRGDNSAPLAAVADLAGGRLGSAGGLAGYGEVQGDPALREMLAGLFRLPADRIVVTNGASEALLLLLHAVADPGEAVALPRPAFPGYRQLARMTQVRGSYYDATGGAARIEVEPGVRAVLACTPHNPTGLLTGRADLPELPDAWRIWDLSHTALFDEATAEFRTGLTEHEAVVFSLSKLLRLPGARVGFVMCGSSALTARLVAAKTHVSMSTGYLSQVLAREVLASGQARAEIAARHGQMSRARRLVQDAVAQSSAFTVAPARGGTHLLLTARDGGDGWKLLKQAGIVGLPGAVFDADDASVRVCTAQPPEVIDAATDLLGKL